MNMFFWLAYLRLLLLSTVTVSTITLIHQVADPSHSEVYPLGTTPAPSTPEDIIGDLPVYTLKNFVHSTSSHAIHKSHNSFV